MKENADKVMTALKEAFPGHKIEYSYNFNKKIYSIFIDDYYVGNFEEDFFKEDLDNPQIEISITAPLNDLKAFTNNIGYESIRCAIERGLSEWEKGLQSNS